MVPLAYSAEQLIVLVRVTYTSADEMLVTRLVAVDSRSHRVVGSVGTAIVGVSSVAAFFVRNSDALVVVYAADPTSDQGITSGAVPNNCVSLCILCGMKSCTGSTSSTGCATSWQYWHTVRYMEALHST